MNLRWITLFATVAEEGSFTQASAKLNIAQPWLSAQIRKLEYELGIELLVRENMGVRVSKAGEQLLPHAQQLAESARLFRETARSLGEDRSREVMLGCHIPLIDIPPLKAVTLLFNERYKNFGLAVSAAPPSELLKALEETRIDIALLPAEFADSVPEIQSIPVGDAKLYLLVPTGQKIKALKDLKGHSVGIPPKDHGPQLHDRLSEMFTDLGIIPSEIPEFDSRAIEHAVLARKESVVVALDDHVPESFDPAVEILPIDPIEVSHRLCRIRDRDLGRAAERFWKICESDFAPIDS